MKLAHACNELCAGGLHASLVLTAPVDGRVQAARAFADVAVVLVIEPPQDAVDLAVERTIANAHTPWVVLWRAAEHLATA